MKLWSITLLFYDQHGLLHRMKLFHLLVSLLLLGTRNLCNSCCVIKMIKQELCCCPSIMHLVLAHKRDYKICVIVVLLRLSLRPSAHQTLVRILCTSSSVINYTLFKLCTCQKAQPTSSCTVVLHEMSVCLALPDGCPKCTEIMIILTEYNCRQVNERGWERKRWNTSENQSTHYL